MVYFCSKCGAPVQEDKNFCANCGVRLVRQPIQKRPAQERPVQERTAQGRQQYWNEAPVMSEQNRHEPPAREQQTREQRQYRQERPAQVRPQYSQEQPQNSQEQQIYNEHEQELQPEPPLRGRGRKKKTALVLTVLFIIIVAAVGFAYLYLRSALSTAPDMRADPRGSGRASSINAGRDTNKYTFLVLGADYGEYNTDVIMAATFDTSGHTFDVVNIPRDTLVNVGWSTKKANSLLANMRARHSGEEDAEAKALQATVEEFANILGYETDYCVMVNIQAFVALIDAIGGVDFDVPVNMNYDDRAGGLSIHYSQGTHHLSGQQALEVLRFRAGYSNADIGRIGTQQSFLQSAAEQILEKRSSLSVIELARVFLKYVKTDMKLDDLIWFGNEFLKLDAGNIKFHVLPGNTGDSVRRQSYVTIYVDEWLELVNSTFNPFTAEVTAGDVSILTRDSDKRLYVTDGNWRADPSWGS